MNVRHVMVSSVPGAAGTASALVREYGPRRAVRIAEAQAESLASSSPGAAAIFAEVARVVERSFVAADMEAARLAGVAARQSVAAT